jgi:UDP-N-acetylglucosamine 2-epimerase (hydrolysing)
VQLGEISHNIFEIGSPDIDLMNPDVLPNLNEVLSHYQIPFLDYALVMYHPVTTEYDYISNHIKCLFNVLKKKNLNYIVIYPNNDFGSNLILKEFETLKRTSNFRFFPSIKFESFLTLLNHAQFIIGNSSAGIREAPHFGVPTVNIGTRQNNRSLSSNIIQSDNSEKNISCSIDKALNLKRFDPERHYGNGKSDELFLNILLDSKFWNIQNQKSFVDLIKI